MNPSLALATVIVDELIRHGVTDVVLCPGSRSAPFAYAVHDADRAGRIRLHVRVDERSAAFTALGLAKVTRVPVPVITTSGTAVVNLFPAVLEASQASVPMVVITADRPAELRGTGANQTTDQVKIFGRATRWFHETASPERREGQNGTWRSVVGRAIAESRGLPSGDPGPVHLNIPLREPLVPTDEAQEWPESLAGREQEQPWLALRAPHSHPPAVTGPGIAPVPRTLVLLGDLPDPAQGGELADLAAAAGWPIVAEPFGRYHRGRVSPHGPLLLSATDWLERNLPERVLVGGRVTLSRDVARLLRHPEVTVEAVTPLTTWADASHVVRRVHDWADIERSHSAVAACVDRAWGAAWRKAGSLIGTRADEVVDASWPSGPAVAATVAHHVPAGGALYVGSSNSARDLDLGRDPQRVARDVVSVSNRGLAGIDGVVSSAVGMALSRPGHANVALMGDLTFLHDSNGLLIGPHEPVPDLTVVVVNDDGGGIFGTLEPGHPDLADAFERVFATPTGTRIAELCAAHGVEHELVTDRERLVERIASPGNGIQVVEVPVARDGQRDLRAQLRAVAADALAES
ncbi:2-succinyl-5-enolpyruvyl-6-hydroxy-3-cyclohexene-1-carboxylic-acid synthase [Luteipulveratus sp. YIM 133132]|uniref:2-succinyl-5-enolpyruvyl-6-hydroxy-3- cyclohexene-1-carboxylic-acid synthase n=1 Tax=Luteipulveratus flavus TaxID=3031728 RepID=UPI0023B0E2EF|nr:2-succinyl-5-enolpyruvyl-6-hydroxy-3-cyclohexene-1-carboxylic-acid synthase [Luteipulveratus sp. YIM 133132]MDE9365094.1 2-succinyl-5-enolpyruvyl-6-hydroxy-3-cyclohexene-1-carboxylic-acid synthase [Luteipulveratus sp. YIM 133132]